MNFENKRNKHNQTNSTSVLKNKFSSDEFRGDLGDVACPSRREFHSDTPSKLLEDCQQNLHKEDVNSVTDQLSESRLTLRHLVEQVGGFPSGREEGGQPVHLGEDAFTFSLP